MKIIWIGGSQNERDNVYNDLKSDITPTYMVKMGG